MAPEEAHAEQRIHLSSRIKKLKRPAGPPQPLVTPASLASSSAGDRPSSASQTPFLQHDPLKPLKLARLDVRVDSHLASLPANLARKLLDSVLSMRASGASEDDICTLLGIDSGSPPNDSSSSDSDNSDSEDMDLGTPVSDHGKDLPAPSQQSPENTLNINLKDSDMDLDPENTTKTSDTLNSISTLLEGHKLKVQQNGIKVKELERERVKLSEQTKVVEDDFDRAKVHLQVLENDLSELKASLNNLNEEYNLALEKQRIEILNGINLEKTLADFNESEYANTAKKKETKAYNETPTPAPALFPTSPLTNLTFSTPTPIDQSKNHNTPKPTSPQFQKRTATPSPPLATGQPPVQIPYTPTKPTPASPPAASSKPTFSKPPLFEFNSLQIDFLSKLTPAELDLMMAISHRLRRNPTMLAELWDDEIEAVTLVSQHVANLAASAEVPDTSDDFVDLGEALGQGSVKVVNGVVDREDVDAGFGKVGGDGIDPVTAITEIDATELIITNAPVHVEVGTSTQLQLKTPSPSKTETPAINETDTSVLFNVPNPVKIDISAQSRMKVPSKTDTPVLSVRNVPIPVGVDNSAQFRIEVSDTPRLEVPAITKKDTSILSKANELGTSKTDTPLPSKPILSALQNTDTHPNVTRDSEVEYTSARLSIPITRKITPQAPPVPEITEQERKADAQLRKAQDRAKREAELRERLNMDLKSSTKRQNDDDIGSERVEMRKHETKFVNVSEKPLRHLGLPEKPKIVQRLQPVQRELGAQTVSSETESATNPTSNSIAITVATPMLPKKNTTISTSVTTATTVIQATATATATASNMIATALNPKPTTTTPMYKPVINMNLTGQPMITNIPVTKQTATPKPNFKTEPIPLPLTPSVSAVVPPPPPPPPPAPAPATNPMDQEAREKARRDSEMLEKVRLTREERNREIARLEQQQRELREQKEIAAAKLTNDRREAELRETLKARNERERRTRELEAARESEARERAAQSKERGRAGRDFDDERGSARGDETVLKEKGRQGYNEVYAEASVKSSGDVQNAVNDHRHARTTITRDSSLEYRKRRHLDHKEYERGSKPLLQE
ncbi:hypothetical protein HK096_010407, partial [Nowakowskiella sp. JEL0078]